MQAYFLTDHRFAELYAPRWTSPNGDNPNLPNGIWNRRAIRLGAPGSERRFINDMNTAMAQQPEPSTAALCSLITHELSLAEGGSATLSKTYVARTVFRYLPEIRAQKDMLPAVVQAFKSSPTYAYDSLLLTSANARDYGGKITQSLTQSLLREVFAIQKPLVLDAPVAQYVDEKQNVGHANGWEAYYVPGVLVLVGDKSATFSRLLRIRTWPKGSSTYREEFVEVEPQAAAYLDGRVVIREMSYDPIDSIEIYSDKKSDTWTIKHTY
jgi:hypothetical protein